MWSVASDEFLNFTSNNALTCGWYGRRNRGGLRYGKAVGMIDSSFTRDGDEMSSKGLKGNEKNEHTKRIESFLLSCSTLLTAGKLKYLIPYQIE